MGKLEKLLPPPMRRPPKPGQTNGNGNGATALEEGEGADHDARTDDPGGRAVDKAKDAPRTSSAGSTSGWGPRASSP